ncbi:hypothetical protein [Kitasatospora sp. NPDC056184]|uniref:hypothetical protein n=1 Tax=Kitasatospora sp. NPDC056184 TaxID=3345738 RepID=UPI0035DB0671
MVAVAIAAGLLAGALGLGAVLESAARHETAPTAAAATPKAEAATEASDAFDAAAWAAVGTAAVAVALVAVGLRLRRRARRS